MGIFLPSVEGSTECGGTIPRGASPAGWSRHTRLIPTHEVDPDTRGWNNPYARARTKVLALLVVRREAPIRMRPAGCLSPIRLRIDTGPTGGLSPIRLRIDTRPMGDRGKAAYSKLRSSTAAPYTSSIPASSHTRLASYSRWHSLRRVMDITFPYRQIIPRGVSYRGGHPVG